MALVLIVDDEANVRRMVGALLAGEGFDVRDAGDGASGVARAEEAEPDVVLLAGKGHEPYQEVAGERRPDAHEEQEGHAHRHGHHVEVGLPHRELGPLDGLGDQRKGRSDQHIEGESHKKQVVHQKSLSFLQEI